MAVPMLGWVVSYTLVMSVLGLLERTEAKRGLRSICPDPFISSSLPGVLELPPQVPAPPPHSSALYGLGAITASHLLAKPGTSS